MSHTRTHIPTDKLNNGTLYAPRYEEAFCLKAKSGLGRLAPSALPFYEEAFMPMGKKRLQNTVTGSSSVSVDCRRL